MIEIPEWPHFLGIPEASGVIRSCPEDYVVEEIPRVKPEGEGSHLWLWVEKRSANTDWVARELAKIAGCPHRDIGYAGLKDRHAVTRQWFSVPATDDTEQQFAKIDVEGVKVLVARSMAIAFNWLSASCRETPVNSNKDCRTSARTGYRITSARKGLGTVDITWGKVSSFYKKGCACNETSAAFTCRHYAVFCLIMYWPDACVQVHGTS